MEMRVSVAGAMVEERELTGHEWGEAGCNDGGWRR